MIPTWCDVYCWNGANLHNYPKALLGHNLLPIGSRVCIMRVVLSENLIHSSRKSQEDGFSLNCHRPTCTGMWSVGSMIMLIKGIAAAAYSGTTKSSAKMPTLLHHLLIASLQQLTETLHLFTGIKGLLFILYAQHFNVNSRHIDVCRLY